MIADSQSAVWSGVVASWCGHWQTTWQEGSSVLCTPALCTAIFCNSLCTDTGRVSSRIFLSYWPLPTKGLCTVLHCRLVHYRSFLALPYKLLCHGEARGKIFLDNIVKDYEGQQCFSPCMHSTVSKTITGPYILLISSCKSWIDERVTWAESAISASNCLISLQSPIKARPPIHLPKVRKIWHNGYFKIK